MKQSELIELIGLKSTDPKLVNLFQKYELGKPPKSINSNQITKSIESKKYNLYFSFQYNITNENFQPCISTKNDDYNFVGYLSSIDFLPKKHTIKTPDPKEDSFWDVSPNLNTTSENIEKIMGLPKFGHNNFYIKKLTKDVELLSHYDLEKKNVKTCWARIIEQISIIENLYFEKIGSETLIFCMLIKWLYDNRYLILNEDVYQISLKNDIDAMLLFIKTHLKNHLYDNQIIENKLLLQFLFNATENNSGLIDEQGNKQYFYVKHIFLKSIGLFEDFELLQDEDAENQLLKQIPFDETNYEKFAESMNKNFDVFKKLYDLESNKK